MWSYYGSKANIVDFYPPPKHDKIIEPFAGSARYALKYWERDVLLVDKYDVIVKLWKWLQLCSPADILKLPRKLEINEKLSDMSFDCEEARYLMGFLIKKGVERPANKPTAWTALQRPNSTNFSLQRIASNLHKIKHWDIRQGVFQEIDNTQATWFIDPPYQIGGHAYVMSNKKIDFSELAKWCKSRQGQVMVCETMAADWMPFRKLVLQKGSKGMQKEAIWTNQNHEMPQQAEMFT